MRRVARAESPESSFRELDDVFLQTQARIWLGEVLHIRFDEETPIADLLADGELLFQVSKIVWKMVLKKHVELKNSKLFIHERTSFAKSDGRYMPYPKVDSFLKICQILGLTGVDLFSPSDVVEKRDIRRVCMCIRSLSKKARSKSLSVPDFDIVTYTIAMPTNLVGGICRSLEKSGCSSSSSGSYSMDFRRLYRQKSYSGHHDQSHDYCYESDEAESSFKELELGSPPSNAPYGASHIFNLDGESFPQRGVVDDNLCELHAYLGQKDRTHGENGHKVEHHGKSIFLESIGSSCGSIIEDDNHDVSIALQSDSCSSCSKLQTDEGSTPYSADNEQGLNTLRWSAFGKQVWNSDIDCFQRCSLLHVKSPYEVEAQMGGKNHSYADPVPENCSPKSSTSDTHMTIADANGEIIKAFVGGTCGRASSTKDTHENMEFECKVYHEKDQDVSSVYILQSHDGKPRCTNKIWLLDENDEHLSHVTCHSFEGKQKDTIHINSKTTAGNSVNGYQSPDCLAKDEMVYPDLICQNIHDADLVLLDSKLSGALLSLSMRNKDSQGMDSGHTTCKHEMKTYDQTIYTEGPSIPTPKLIPDKAATMALGDKLQHNDLGAGVSLFPAVHTFKDNLSSVVSEVSLNEHSADGNWKNRDIMPNNCSAYIEFVDVTSALETNEWNLTRQSDNLSDSQTSVSKGQDFVGILDGSCPKDTHLTNTCSSPTHGTLETKRKLLFDTSVQEKTNLCNCIIARDANKQLNDSVVHQDGDATVDGAFAVKTKAHGKIVGCQMQNTDSNFIGSWSELKAENLYTEIECEIVTQVDAQDNNSYHDPYGENRDLLVEVGSDLFENKCGKNKSNHHMECRNIAGSFRESSSDLITLDLNYDYAISVPTAEVSCMPTCSGESSEQTLPVEERNIGHSHSSVPTVMFSLNDTSSVCLQHMDNSILSTSYETSLQMTDDIAGRNCVNDLYPYGRNEICGLGSGVAEVTENSEVSCSHCSNELRYMEYMGIYNANEVTSEPAHCLSTANTNASAVSGDDCTRTHVIFPCSNPGILAEGQGDGSAETNLNVKYQVHLMDDVGTSMNHTVPHDNEERKKDMEEHEKNPLPATTLSGKNSEETVPEIRNPGKKVLKSIAGSVTLIGALLVFLHLRGKREKEKTSRTVVPLQTKESAHEVYTQNRGEIGKSDKKYPGERLML